MGDARSTAIDAIGAARTAALADLAQLEAAAGRVADAVVRIRAQALLAQQAVTAPAELDALVAAAEALQRDVRALTATVARVNQWGQLA